MNLLQLTLILLQTILIDCESFSTFNTRRDRMITMDPTTTTEGMNAKLRSETTTKGMKMSRSTTTPVSWAQKAAKSTTTTEATTTRVVTTSTTTEEPVTTSWKKRKSTTVTSTTQKKKKKKSTSTSTTTLASTSTITDSFTFASVIDDDDNEGGEEEVFECGRSGALSSRIIGGRDTELNEFPWHAALGYNISGAIQFLCGGTLVGKQHIVSAAHCCLDILVLVRLGEYNLKSDDDGASPINVRVIKRMRHEYFNQKTMENDISVLKLAEEVTFTRQILPICMPTSDDMKSRDWMGYVGTVVGWGTTSFRGATSDILQEVQLPIMDLDQCFESYDKFLPFEKFDNRTLCAGYDEGGKDSCSGDSGGSLIIPETANDGTVSIYYFIGVVSYGYECARAHYPGIYTRVSTFLPWIQRKLDEA